MGPGKVVFQDGKVIFVRHGAVLVRVSANRIVRKGEEYAKENIEGENIDNEKENSVASDSRNQARVTIDDNLDIDEGSDDDKVDDLENQVIDVSIENDEGSDHSEIDKEVVDMEETLIEENGKRKRSQEKHAPAQKIVRLEDEGNGTRPAKRLIYPPSEQAKMMFKRGDIIEFEDEGQITKATIMNREKITGRYYNYFNVHCEDGITRNINGERVNIRKLEEEECNMVLIPAERHKDEDCMNAKQVELGKLKEFETYDVVPDEGQHRISCRWVLWYKGDEVRARLTARGFEEKEKVASDSPTIDKCNVRIVLTICQSKGWVLETSDVKSAFLQGHELDREVHIQPPKEASVAKGQLWKLKVALYGLNDASLQFFIKSKRVLLDLGCQQSTMDPALFYKRNSKGELIGLICAHVDDYIHCGTKEFQETVIKKLVSIFQMGKTERRQFQYVGFDIKQDETGIRIDQSTYAADLDIVDVNPERAKQTSDDLQPEEKSTLREVAGRIGWLGRGTRPELLFSQVELSTKFVNGKVSDLNQAAKLIRKVKGSESFVVIKNIGEVEDWCVEVSTDASLCNLNNGVGSTGAKVVLLVNKVTGLCAPVSWHCNKISRVVDSTLAAECMSLKDGLHEAVYVRQVIEEIFGMKDKSIEIHGIVDNRGTVDAVHSTTSVKDKKLRRDVAGIKEMMNEGEVTRVTWCAGKEQLADCMTKRGAAAWGLMQVFRTGRRYEV